MPIPPIPSIYVPKKYSKEFHVDPVNGSDGNPGSEEKPVLTIARACTLAGNTGCAVILHEGIYTAWPAGGITNQNLDLVSYAGNRSSAQIQVAATFAGAGSSIRVQGIYFTQALTLNTNAAANLYFYNCQTSSTVTKTTAGYTEFVNCLLDNPTAITVSGGGYTTFISCRMYDLTVSSATAIVTVRDCVSIANPTCTAGVMALINTSCLAKVAGGNAVTTSAGTTLYMIDSSASTTTGAVGKISVAGSYGFTNAQFDIIASTVTGTNINTLSWFDTASSRGFVTRATTTASSATTITLTTASTRSQIITGSVAQTIRLPLTTTLLVGDAFRILNLSTQNVTVQTSTGTNVGILAPGTPGEFIYTNQSATGWTVITSAPAATRTEILTVTALDTLSALTIAYSAGTATLVVNGVVVSNLFPGVTFSAGSTTVIWDATTLGFNLVPGDQVTVTYPF